MSEDNDSIFGASEAERAPDPPSSAPSAPSGGKVVAVTNEKEAQAAVDELVRHRQEREGKLIGLAGSPRHGKSEFARKLRDALGDRKGDVEDYAKTYAGLVNFYYLPKTHRRDVLIDLAGEDFDQFGDARVPIPLVMERLLWPTLQKLDALMLFVALPYLWSGWNQVDGGMKRLEPSETDVRATREATRKMIASMQMLIRYAIVAKNLSRIRKDRPALALDRPAGHEGSWIPDRETIHDAFQVGGQLTIPVFVAFSKSDVIQTSVRPDGLLTPPISRGRQAMVRADEADPMVLGKLAFPDLFEFLEKHVRYFKFDFLQVVRDRSPNPNPEGVAGTALPDAEPELRGVFGALDFMTEHLWWLPTPGTRAALAHDRRASPQRWTEEVDRLVGTATADA